jgi:hypothetical protein
LGKSEGKLGEVGGAHGSLDFAAVGVEKGERRWQLGIAFSAEFLIGVFFAIVNVIQGGFTGRFVHEHH